MKSYYLIISSRNKKSLDNFELFFFNLIKSNFNILNKDFKKKREKKRFTILKSPHVNKTAQETFEYRTYSRAYIIHLANSSLFLLFFKKLKKYLFLDIEFKLKTCLHNKQNKLNQSNLFHPKKYKLNYATKTFLTQNSQITEKKKEFQTSNKNLLLKTKKILKSMDVYGELLLTKKNAVIHF